MYILKNAWRNVLRFKGRNILIGIIITIITISACVALSIKNSSNTLIESYKDSNDLSVSFTLNPMNLKDATEEEKEEFESLTIDSIEKYGDSDYVKSYYYTLELSANSDDVEAVDYSELKMDDSKTASTNAPEMPNDEKRGSSGDFRITAYSNVSYLDDFVSGTKKIREGSMITNDSSMEIVISEDLADENDLKLGDSVSFTNASDEDDSQTFKITGIYEDTTDVNGNSFGGNMMNSRNQIYTSISSIQKYNLETDADTENTKKMMNSNGLTAEFYLKDKDDVEEYEKEVRSKGLSDYYTLTTNEDEITQTLKPIQNLTSFSITFLIVTLVVGGIILTIINVLNIRERKYEMGVLRAIGMSKVKVTLQLLIETLIISMISFIVGLLVGILLSQPVTNKMLKSEIESYQTESTNVKENFGGENFKGGNSEGGPRNNKTLNNVMNNTNFVSSLDVKTNGLTIVYIFLITIGLTSITGVIAVTFINKCEPNRILQNRI